MDQTLYSVHLVQFRLRAGAEVVEADQLQVTEVREAQEAERQEAQDQEMQVVIVHQKETMVVHKVVDPYTPEVVAEVPELSEETAQLIQATQELELHQILIIQGQQQHFQQEEDQGDILYLHQQDQMVQLIKEKEEKVQTALFHKEVLVALEVQAMYL